MCMRTTEAAASHGHYSRMFIITLLFRRANEGFGRIHFGRYAFDRHEMCQGLATATVNVRDLELNCPDSSGEILCLMM